MGVAEVGRRKGNGTVVFPLAATMAAPLWVLERAASAWLALGARVVFGGVPYAGRRLRRAATPSAKLAQRFAAGRRENRRVVVPTHGSTNEYTRG